MPAHRALQTLRDEHASLAAMLQSLRLMVQRGPGGDPRKFFDVLRAMLFYIDEFPERLHHPKEANLLFPRLVKRDPQVLGAVDQIEREHQRSEKNVRDLQHLLLAWELLGPGRRSAFEDAIHTYIDFYLAHMDREERTILAAAERTFSKEDWASLDAAFAQQADPLSGPYPPTELYEKLFSLVVTRSPSPIGLG